MRLGVNMAILEQLRCENCGAPLNVYIPFRRATCEHCGSNYYLDNIQTLSDTNGILADNPKDIEIIRDELSSPLSMIDMPDPYIIKQAVCLIAGVSFMTGKSYEMYGFGYDGLEDSFTYDPKELKRAKSSRGHRNFAKREFTLSDRDRLDKLPDILAEKSRTGLNKRQRLLDGLSDLPYLKVEEISKTITPQGFTNEAVAVHCVRHKLICKMPLITPHFLPAYYPEIVSRYSQIKNHPAIDVISSELAKCINNLSLCVSSNVILKYSYSTTGCGMRVQSWDTLEGAADLVFSNSVNFHSVGMENLDFKDFCTSNAVGLAVLSKVFDNTIKNGRLMIDLSPNESVPARDSLYLLNKSLVLKDEIVIALKYLEHAEKRYAKW